MRSPLITMTGLSMTGPPLPAISFAPAHTTVLPLFSGEGVAGGLLGRGLTVVTLQRSAPRIKHPNLHFRPIDLTDLEATKSLARGIAAEVPVGYLVVNAGS